MNVRDVLLKQRTLNSLHADGRRRANLKSKVALATLDPKASLGPKCDATPDPTNGSHLRPDALGAFALGAAMTCSGCSPIEPSYISPEIHGRVIDAATKKPIAGAEIALRECNGNALVVTRSTSDGKIDIAEIVKFDRPLISMGLDAYVRPTTLEINASGYDPAKQEIEHRKPWTGTVELHRLPAPN